MASDSVLIHIDEHKGIGWAGLQPRPVFSGPLTETCSVELCVEHTCGGIVAQARLTNSGSQALKLRNIRWVSSLQGSSIHPTLLFAKSLDPFYFATENFRGDFFGTGTTRGEHYFKPLPNESVTLGCSEDLVFPGLFIGAARQPLGLFCAAASRRVFELQFRLFGGDRDKWWNFEIEEQPQGLDALEIAPGQTLSGERIFFAICDSNEPQRSTSGYYQLLEQSGAFSRRKHNPLAAQRIWCSWNFGYYDKINEQEVLKQLPLLREHFPSVKFVQVDDGYERVYPSGQRAQIDLLYNTDTPYDTQRFPNGPKALTGQIKAAGFRPATWLGLWAAGTSEMIQEHPEWVLLDDMGRRMAFSSQFAAVYGGPFQICVLDPSVPGVRRYLETLFRTVFQDWGFEGLKLDFYSFAFQIRRARFRCGNQTAAQHLQWMLDTLRAYLPEDGFLGLCSVAGTGTPLMGLGADYFRSGEDISEGDWRLAKNIGAWFANTNMLLQQPPILPNVDSIGWGKSFSGNGWESFLNFCTISGGALEIGGDLTRLEPARLGRLRRALERCDPLRRVRCLDVPKDRLELPPALWVSEGAQGCVLAGVFNWSDEQRTIDTQPLARYVPEWPDKFEVLEQGAAVLRDGKIELAPQASLLFAR